MNDNKTTATDQPVLNPLALPAETDARFVLLTVAAVILCFVAGMIIAQVIELTFFQPVDPVATPADITALDGIPAVAVAGAQQHLSRLMLPTFLVILVFIAAIWHYRGHPSRLQRQRKLQHLTPVRDPKLWEEVQRLAAISGVDPPPGIVINRNLQGREGQAFGLRKAPLIRLDGGLRLVLRKIPMAFRAVLLHELGHHANGDVRRSYFAQSLWQMTALIAVVPMIASLGILLLQALVTRVIDGSADWSTFFNVNLPTYGAIWLQLGGLTLLVMGVRASLLRVREYYADWRAALWGELQGLHAVLQKPDKALTGWDRLRRWWRLHPTPDDRRAVLEDPGRLFRLAADLPFVAGWLVALLCVGGFEIAGNLGAGLGFRMIAEAADWLAAAGTGQGELALLLAILVALLLTILAALLALLVVLLPVLGISLLMTWVVSLQAIREDLWRQVGLGSGHGRFRRSLQTTTILLLGFELGVLSLPLRGNWSPFASPTPDSGAGSLFFMLIWWGCAIGLISLWFWFARLVGMRWLERHMGAGSPHRKLWVILLLSGGVLWPFFISLAAGRIMILFNPAPQDMGLWTAVMLLGVVVGMGTIICLSVGSWTLLRWRRVRCANCKHPFAIEHPQGASCPGCRSLSAAWMFVNQRRDKKEISSVRDNRIGSLAQRPSPAHSAHHQRHPLPRR